MTDEQAKPEPSGSVSQQKYDELLEVAVFIAMSFDSESWAAISHPLLVDILGSWERYEEMEKALMEKWLPVFQATQKKDREDAAMARKQEEADRQAERADYERRSLQAQADQLAERAKGKP